MRHAREPGTTRAISRFSNTQSLPPQDSRRGDHTSSNGRYDSTGPMQSSPYPSRDYGDGRPSSSRYRQSYGPTNPPRDTATQPRPARPTDLGYTFSRQFTAKKVGDKWYEIVPPRSPRKGKGEAYARLYQKPTECVETGTGGTRIITEEWTTYHPV